MPACFTSRNDILVRTRDGRNVVLQEPLDLVADGSTRYRVPAGAASDGASTPPALWPFLPPFGGYWLAAVVHDAAYRGTLLKFSGNAWVPAMLSKAESDNLLFDLMVACSVPEATRNTIFEGVSVGGWKAFRNDRAAPS